MERCLGMEGFLTGVRRRRQPCGYLFGEPPSDGGRFELELEGDENEGERVGFGTGRGGAYPSVGVKSPYEENVYVSESASSSAKLGLAGVMGNVNDFELELEP